MNGEDVRERLSKCGVPTPDSWTQAVDNILAELADAQHHDSEHLGKTSGLCGELLARIEKLEAMAPAPGGE